MQEIIVLLAVLIAGIYVFYRVKKVLTVGEEDRKCPNCPVNMTNASWQKFLPGSKQSFTSKSIAKPELRNE